MSDFERNRYRINIVNPKKLCIRVSGTLWDGCEKLAHLDMRSVRDWVRRRLHEVVEQAVRDGTITRGPLSVTNPVPDSHAKKGATRKVICTTVDEACFQGVEKLAYLDGRGARDWIRWHLHTLVTSAIESKTIAPGPMKR